MPWHYLACPDCTWHTTQRSPVAASTVWAEHYATAHTQPSEETC